MLRIKLNSDGREKLNASKITPPTVPLPKHGTKISVARVAELLRIDPNIVRNFFVTTQDHKRYPADHELPVLLTLQNHQLYFDEAKLMIFFDMNYVGMKELYWSRKQAWLRQRAAQ